MMITVDALFSKFKASSGYVKYMSSEDLEDLKQDSIVYALQVMKNYDPNRGQICTYLTPYIRGFYQNYVIKQISVAGHNKTLYSGIIEKQKVDTNIDDECYFMMLNFDRESVMASLEKMFKYSDLCEFIELFKDLSDKALYIIVNHYFLEKSMKKISIELGYKTTFQVYEIRKKALEKLKGKILLNRRIANV